MMLLNMIFSNSKKKKKNELLCSKCGRKMQWTGDTLLCLHCDWIAAYDVNIDWEKLCPKKK